MASKLEEEFLLQIRALRLPEPHREFRFNVHRRWRFDFCWPSLRLAVEVDGGLWKSKSRHTSSVGFHRDLEKINSAMLDNWFVLRGDTTMVRTGELARNVELFFIKNNEKTIK